MSAPSPTRKRESWYEGLVSLAGVVAAFEVVLRLFPWESSWRMLRNGYVSGRPLWLWLLVYWISVVVISAVWTQWWNPGVFRAAQKLWQFDRTLFYRRLVKSMAVALSSLILATLLQSGTTVSSLEARKLFSQENEVGPLRIDTYGTDGMARYLIQKDAGDYGPAPKDVAKITFQTFGDDLKYNCGWVVYFPPGMDLSTYTQLQFSIRGTRGDEKLILKAKDSDGHEESLELDERSLTHERITNLWQIAKVPFSRFGNVNFTRMDNISLASNGSLNHKDRLEVYVGDFYFLK